MRSIARRVQITGVVEATRIHGDFAPLRRDKGPSKGEARDLAQTGMGSDAQSWVSRLFILASWLARDKLPAKRNAVLQMASMPDPMRNQPAVLIG